MLRLVTVDMSDLETELARERVLAREPVLEIVKGEPPVVPDFGGLDTHQTGLVWLRDGLRRFC